MNTARLSAARMTSSFLRTAGDSFLSWPSTL
jgi:hypothetical protein